MHCCMRPETYKLVEPIAGFSEDEILDVTARFGDWHHHDVKLEPQHPAATGSIELTVDELEAVATPIDQPA